MFLQKQAYIKHGETILNEYIYLTGRCVSNVSEYDVPFIGELIEETLATASYSHHEQLIAEAVMRREYEVLGMSKQEFTHQAMNNQVRGFEYATVGAVDVQDQVTTYLRTRNMSFINYGMELVSSPIGQGVW